MRERARVGEGKPSSQLASDMGLESKLGMEASERKHVGRTTGVRRAREPSGAAFTRICEAQTTASNVFLQK